MFLNIGHSNCQQFAAYYMCMTAGRTNNISVGFSCENLKGKNAAFLYIDDTTMIFLYNISD
jgi:hypothetical protein